MPEPSNRVATPVSQAQSAPIIERTARIYELSKGTLIVRIPSFGDCAKSCFLYSSKLRTSAALPPSGFAHLLGARIAPLMGMAHARATMERRAPPSRFCD